MKIKIQLEGNDYIVYNGDDYLESFDRSKLGDEVARKLANAYKSGYESGFEQAETNHAEDEAGASL